MSHQQQGSPTHMSLKAACAPFAPSANTSAKAIPLAIPTALKVITHGH